MGQKVDPIAIRLGINQSSQSTWFAQKSDYSRLIKEDNDIRVFLQDNYGNAGISKIFIDRSGAVVQVNIKCARPGVLIGKKGADVDSLRRQVTKVIQAKCHVAISEVKKPDLDAKIVAESIANQLANRGQFRRVMKRAISTIMRAGAKGTKIMVSGRVGGAEIARSESYKEGRVPLQTFRSNLDYALALSHTTYGVLGVKVWIYKGDSVINESKQEENRSV